MRADYKLKAVKLLIFDFDGTLMQSQTANWRAANFCLTKLNYPRITLKTITAHLGETAPDYYQHLIKRADKTDWQQLQTCVEANAPHFFNRYLKLYPRVKQTLKKLKQRGYSLVLYSNAPRPYFRAALHATGLQNYFDLTQELKPHATKTSTIARIIKRFKLPAAVIGDRDHDLTAARNNQALAIFCAYGFGAKAIPKPDIYLKKFSDLTKIFE